MALPLNKGHRRPDQVITLLRRFEFESPLMRSGVVAIDIEEPDTGLLFVRGAPATIAQLIRGGQIPEDYRQVIKSCQDMTAICFVDGIQKRSHRESAAK